MTNQAQQLLERAKSEGTPLIDGDQVIFVWQGAQAQLIGDFNHWAMGQALIPMVQVASDLWTYTVRLPPYFEYAVISEGVRQPDPLNRQRVSDGMGHINSTFWMPDAVDTPLARAKRSIPRGKLTRTDVFGRGYIVGRDRRVHFYQPPTDEPTPLLVVFDGSGYLRKARLATIVDNLIAQRRIRPIAMALVDPGGQGRTVEYACSDTTTAYIIQCVLPEAHQRLNLLDVAQTPGAYGMMGASMGGLMSLYIAHRAPEIFGHVLCESGAFGADFLFYQSVLDDLIRYAPRPDIRIWMDVGLHEWYIHPNRTMHALLRERGYDVAYTEHTSGHNYPSWRNILWRGLEHLYPPTKS